MSGYCLKRSYFVSTVAFFVLILSLVAMGQTLNPDNYNSEDLQNVTDAVEADTTDDNTYNKDSYNCYHFARDLQYNLWHDHNTESQLVNIKYTKDGEEHEHNAVKVTIRDNNGQPTDVYIEPQNDNMFTSIEDLLQGLNPNANETIEITESSETAVLFPVITTYVGNSNTHGSLPVSGSEQTFTVRVTVIDAQRRAVANQNVTITITHTDGTTSTITGVTNQNGEASGDVTTNVTGNDIATRKQIKVEATIHVLPQENEGQDSRDPSTTRNLRLLLDRRQSCAPTTPNGTRPDRPIYLNEDGQFALAEFPFYNNTASPIEIQPALDCRRNCDASDVIEVAFIPETLAIPPFECASVRAAFSNLTAPAGDTIIGHLYGNTGEPDLVFINVYDPALGAPCTPTNTMLDFFGITDIAPPARLLDTSNCTWASDGSSCEFPDPSQDICALDTLLVDLNSDTIAQLIGGESPADLIIPVSPGQTPPPGQYHLLIAHCKGNILDSPYTHHQYAFPCDSDGLSFNNYTSGPPWTKDFFIDTDWWLELLGDPDGWTAQVRDPGQGFNTISSNSFFAVAGPELLGFIPEGELTSSATFRATAFGHMGFYLFGPWSGRVQPPVGEGPLFPVATNPIVVTPQYEASNPGPSNFSFGVPENDTHLSWASGFGSNFSEVNFGDVFPPPFAGSTTSNSFDPGPLNQGTNYYWQIEEQQNDGTRHLSPVWNFATGTSPSRAIVREMWELLNGTNVSDLTSNEKFEGEPTFIQQLTSFDAPVNIGDNYGSRIQGWLNPVTSGDYTFWIASDDSSQLWLSSDYDPANAEKIAEVPGWTSHQQWHKYPEQQSDPVPLTGGERYFLSALQKEGSGDDNLSVAWEGPDSPTRSVIDADFFSPFNTWNFPPSGTVVHKASNPSPANGTTIPDTLEILEWTGDPAITSYNVYISENRDDVQTGADEAFAGNVKDPILIIGQGEGLFPEGLTPGKTYYWSVVGTAPGEIIPGPIWSFTVAVSTPPDNPIQRITDFSTFEETKYDLVVGDDGTFTAKGGFTLQNNSDIGIDEELDILGVVSDGEPGTGLHFQTDNQGLGITADNGTITQVFISLDGVDGDALTVHSGGIIPLVDLTFGGTQKGVTINVEHNKGNPIDAGLIFFSGNPDDSIEKRFSIPQTDDPLSIDLPYNNFTVRGNGNPENTGAAVLFLGTEGGIEGPLDLQLTSMELMP